MISFIWWCKWERSQEHFFHIYHFYLDNNTPCFPWNLAWPLYSISPGHYSYPKRNQTQWLCKIWWVNKVHYGLCENGEFEKSYLFLHLHHQIKLFKNLTSLNRDLTYPYLPPAGDHRRRFFLKSLRMNVLYGTIDRNIRQVFP